MAKLTGPLFSQKASKQLGKNLIYKTKGQKGFVTGYNKPGGKISFDPSPAQINKRMLYNLIIACWQCKTSNQKKVFDDIVTKLNLKMSGWNYFYREAIKDLPTYLGLQGYWAFNQIVSGKYQDLSGNGNHGTPKPLYPSNYPQMVDSINKKFGKAGSFDGIDDYVDCGTGIDFESIDITPSFWIKSSQLSYAYPFGNGAGGGGNGWGTLIYTYGKISIDIYPVGGSRQTIVSSTIITDNNWHFVVSTIDRDGYMRLFIDGKEDAIPKDISAQSALSLNRYSVKIGKAGASPLDGLIDEVRIYNRALSAAEIKKHYDLISK